VFFVLVFVLYPLYLVQLQVHSCLEPSLIALVNVSTPLAALVKLTTLNHQILFLQLFQLLLKLVQGPNKNTT
jgi:hypothetical protein